MKGKGTKQLHFYTVILKCVEFGSNLLIFNNIQKYRQLANIV